MISWALAGVAALLGLLVAIFAVTDFGDLGDYSDQYKSIPDNVLSQIDVPSPTTLWILTIVALVGALGAIGGGVLIYLKHSMAGMLTAAAGGLMLIAGIVYLIVEGDISEAGDSPNVPVWALIGGIIVGAIGALAFIPQTKKYLGGESVLAGPGGPGGFGGPPPGGGFGQQPPPQQGFGQPPQQGFGGPPPGGGFGQQPPQQGFGQPPQQGGPPPQQW